MFELSSLTQSIRNILALSGLSLLSFSGQANDVFDPNEIRYNPGEIKGVCAQDAEQDGDLDLYLVYENQVSILTNAGTAESPDFLPPKPIYKQSDRSSLIRHGLTDCRLFDIFPPEQWVDIDADGDLDLFAGHGSKVNLISGLEFFRNEGTNEMPEYVREIRPDFFELSSETQNAHFIFKDFDNDGDFDFFTHPLFSENAETIFFENIGTPQEAVFQKREHSPVRFACDNLNIGFLADIDNDKQLETLCIGTRGSALTLLDQDASGYLPKQILVPASHSASSGFLQALDIDNDGDLDILNNDFDLYLNSGSNEFPNFQFLALPDQIKPPTTPEQSIPSFTGQLADLDGDNDFDYINGAPSIGWIEYAVNIGSNTHPVFDKNTFPPEFQSCNDFFQNNSYDNLNFALNDIDHDDDLDLFANVKIPMRDDPLFFCENQGDANTPLFASVIENPFGLSEDTQSRIIFYDMDGDGDQDLWTSKFYENTGSPTAPHFQRTTQITLWSGYNDLLDLNGDGRVESALTSNSVLINELEPATDISVTVSRNSSTSAASLIIAINRPSRLTLMTCLTLDSFCGSRQTVLPHAAQAISVSAGNLDESFQHEIVLATIDTQGMLKIHLYDATLNLIASREIGYADSVSVATGQLDSDPEDEYVITQVLEDGKVAALGYNLDGSLVGKIVANLGTQPQFATGESPLPGFPYFALSYLTPDKQLETMTFHHDTTPLATTRGGAASQASVLSMDLTPAFYGDEYITSLVQADGRVALVAYSSNGVELGNVVGGVSQQPKVLSGHFPDTNSTGLTVSLIREDKKPAIYFLDKQGNVLAEGVGYTEAVVSDHIVGDTDFDGIEEAILVYIDEKGIPRWEIFDFNGNKR